MLFSDRKGALSPGIAHGAQHIPDKAVVQTGQGDLKGPCNAEKRSYLHAGRIEQPLRHLVPDGCQDPAAAQGHHAGDHCFRLLGYKKQVPPHALHLGKTNDIGQSDTTVSTFRGGARELTRIAPPLYGGFVRVEENGRLSGGKKHGFQRFWLSI